MTPSLSLQPGQLTQVQAAVNAQKSQRAQLSPAQIQALLQYPVTPSEQPRIFRKRDTGLAGTLLVAPSGKRYLLLTSTKSGDPVLGKGSFKTAKVAIDLETGKRYALAVCKKSALANPNRWESLKDELQMEIALMQELKGKEGVVQIETAVMTEDKCYILMEYCDRGELFDSVIWKETINSFLSPREKLQIAKDCAAGIRSCHEAGILHRDLKLDNVFLYLDENRCLRAKIADFGHACKKDDQAALGETCGTCDWVSPEKAGLYLQDPIPADQMREKTTEATDMWPLGIIFFTLFQEKAPVPFSFQRGETEAGVLQRISNLCCGGPAFVMRKEIDRASVVPAAVPLVKRMLSIKPSERPTIVQVEQELAKL